MAINLNHSIYSRIPEDESEPGHQEIVTFRPHFLLVLSISQKFPIDFSRQKCYTCPAFH